MTCEDCSWSSCARTGECKKEILGSISLGMPYNDGFEHPSEDVQRAAAAANGIEIERRP